jgi:ketosteroid isomerase-like protein
MSTEQTQKAMQNYLDLLQKRGDYGPCFSDDVTFSMMGPGQVVSGRPAVEQFIRAFHEQWFDARPEWVTVINGDGKAVLEAVFRGNHIGEFFGVGATGRSVELPYAVIYDLRGDKITALRVYMSVDVLMGQLTAAEPAAA